MQALRSIRISHDTSYNSTIVHSCWSVKDAGCGMRDAGAPHPASRVGKGRGMRVAESSEIAFLGFRMSVIRLHTLLFCLNSGVPQHVIYSYTHLYMDIIDYYSQFLTQNEAVKCKTLCVCSTNTIKLCAIKMHSINYYYCIIILTVKACSLQNICITESWLSPELSDSELFIPAWLAHSTNRHKFTTNRQKL